MLFAILQKYDFSSKSQQSLLLGLGPNGCLRYCKSTIFQANHNNVNNRLWDGHVVCDTAKVRFFKQITTAARVIFRSYCCLRYCKSTIFQANHNEIDWNKLSPELFAILQKYDFSSKSQLGCDKAVLIKRCLRYCKSTIFQANHNFILACACCVYVVCDTAKVRFFKQITTALVVGI